MLDPIPSPPPVRPVATPPSTNLLAILSLVFGVSAWLLLPLIGAIAAVVLGHMARAELRRVNPPIEQGDGLAVGGLILGYAQLVLIGLVFVFVMLVFAGIVGLGLSGHH